MYTFFYNCVEILKVNNVKKSRLRCLYDLNTFRCLSSLSPTVNISIEYVLYFYLLIKDFWRIQHFTVEKGATSVTVRMYANVNFELCDFLIQAHHPPRIIIPFILLLYLGTSLALSFPEPFLELLNIFSLFTPYSYPLVLDCEVSEISRKYIFLSKHISRHWPWRAWRLGYDRNRIKNRNSGSYWTFRFF